MRRSILPRPATLRFGDSAYTTLIEVFLQAYPPQAGYPPAPGYGAPAPGYGAPAYPPQVYSITHSALIFLSSRATPRREAILRPSSKAILPYVLSMPMLSLITAGRCPALSVAAARPRYAASSLSPDFSHKRDKGPMPGEVWIYLDRDFRGQVWKISMVQQLALLGLTQLLPLCRTPLTCARLGATIR